MKICLETLRFGDCHRKENCYFKETHSWSHERLLLEGRCGLELSHGYCTAIPCKWVHSRELPPYLHERDAALNNRHRYQRRTLQIGSNRRERDFAHVGAQRHLAYERTLSGWTTDENKAPETPTSIQTYSSSVRGSVDSTISIDVSVKTQDTQDTPPTSPSVQSTDDVTIKVHDDKSVQAKDIEEKLKAFDNKHPPSARYLHNKGKNEVRRGHLNRAIAFFSQGLEQANVPGDLQMSLLYARADANYRTANCDRHADILRDCLLIIDREPLHLKALRLVARIQASHGRVVAAIDMLDRILSAKNIEREFREEVIAERDRFFSTHAATRQKLREVAAI